MKNWLLGGLFALCISTTVPCFAAKRRDTRIQKVDKVSQAGVRWLPYQEALHKASKEGKFVALFFTGSDWCIWCMRMQEQILRTDAFSTFANQHLYMVEIDFPHNNEQTPEQKALNQQLKTQYQVEGFPTLVLLDPQGKEISKLGFEHGGGENYVHRLKKILHIS
ncbi:disulfide reductase DsbH [Chlamydia sp.]|uniref:disulfide reductase DsbH n=1 Tax=Chlamydia sp. TaxID=35827 RepID=UPI0025BC3455|nr:disulfide reductase DsbH [Chlamydia sp.]MBQ8498574.1 thioredoxin family protein [Chlamydia sp.]